MNPVRVTNDIQLGGGALALIAGPCLIEDVGATTAIALELKALCADLSMPFVFKASYDKANRTSVTSARGPGWEAGLERLAEVKERAQVPVLSDVHETAQVERAAQVCDILQVPAFLCRQTDLLVACGESGRVVNVKKGQFMAPADMRHSAGKVTSTGNQRVTLTERGFAFGYNNLVVDMRGLPIMRSLGFPVVFDATHSVQLPSGAGGASGGQREFITPLAQAAVAAGVDAVFMETHPHPDNAPCDGPNMIPLADLRALLVRLQAIHAVVNGA
jgi:2-dehydro-3-deoxyphosphooctonate aldolase (KDO 8-P synthase)